MHHQSTQRGFVLLPVVLLIVLISVVAFMVNHESVLDSGITASNVEAAQAEWVARAGLQHTLWQIAQAGCGVYTDIAGESLGSHGYSSTITTNNAGSALTTVSVPVTDDAYIDEGQPTNNYGSDAKLKVYQKWFDSKDQRALYRFDIENAGIAPGALVVSAVMKVFVVTPDPQHSVSVHRVTANWDEASVTWDSINGAFDWSSIDSIPANPSAGQFVELNITSLAQGWINGAISNQGVMLLPNLLNDNDLSEYSSKEYSTVSQQPWLEITVSDGSLSNRATVTSTGTLADGTSRTLIRKDVVLYQNPPGSLLLQPDAAEGQDAEIWDQAPNNNYGNAAETWVSSASNDTTRTLLYFDMGAIPFGAHILDATLSLRRRSGSGSDQPVSAHRIRNPWDEATVTWNQRVAGTNWDTAGADFDSMAFATTPVGPANQRYEWDITPLAQGWVDGSYPNYGVILVAAVPGMPGERFDTSDHADPSRWPSLSISYTCECGITCLAPQGSGSILMAVGDDVNLAEADGNKKSLFESWGYTVNLIDDGSNQGAFDTALGNNDVAYISETVSSNTLGNKLASTGKGVVTEDDRQLDNLGFASSGGNSVGSSLAIIDNTHYITALFPAGVQPVFDAQMEGMVITGTPAPALLTLGEFTGVPGLAVIEAGGMTQAGSPAPGRRATVPIGSTSKFNWDYLNNNGRLIVQRALQWGTGNTGGSCTPGNLRDEFTTAAFNNSDGSLPWAGDWIELDGSGTGPSSGKARITGGELRLNGTPAGDDPSLAREMDLSSHLSATLGFDFRSGPGVEAGEDGAVVEISSNGGTSWTVLEDFIDEGPGASGSRSYDISGFLSTDTRVRFRISAAYGGPSEYFYVDNLEITASCTPPVPPAGGNLLLVVVDPGNLTAQEAAKKTLIESWGYTVSLIDESDSQANFDTAVAANDVVYITEDVSSTQVGTKLVNATIGVVTEEANLSDEFGLSDGIGWGSGVEIQIDDNTHYITQLFAGGNLTILTTSESLAYLTPSLAPDAAILGRIVGGLSLTAVEAGADVTAGRTAAGRRVLLPWGGNDMDVNHLNSDGLTIMRRAIEWGAGVGAVTGPIAHWKLDDGTGTTAVDSEGGHDGTLINGPTWTAGQDGGALEFDGSNDYVDLTSDTELDDVFVGGATVMAWIEPASWGGNGYGRILDKSSSQSSTGDGWAIRLNTDNGGLNFGQGFTGGRGWWRTPGNSINLDSWQHVAIVYDASAASNDPLVYLNGNPVLVTEVDTPSGSVLSDAAINLRLGNHAGGTTNGFDGIIDDARIYDRMLSASEIAGIAATGGGGGGGGGCSGTYRDNFDVVDYSQNDGTLTWATDWEETGETTDPAGGDIRIDSDVSNYQLLVRDDGQTVMREADLSTAASATLSFDYRRENLSGSSDYVAVEVSYNGGSSWSELDRFTGTATDASYTSTSYVLDAASLSASTRIRFLTPGSGMSNSNRVWFDNVQIQCTP